MTYSLYKNETHHYINAQHSYAFNVLQYHYGTFVKSYMDEKLSDIKRFDTYEQARQAVTDCAAASCARRDWVSQFGAIVHQERVT